MKQVMRGKSVLSDRRFDSKIKKLFFVWWFAWRSIYASESKLEKIRLAYGILLYVVAQMEKGTYSTPKNNNSTTTKIVRTTPQPSLTKPNSNRRQNSQNLDPQKEGPQAARTRIDGTNKQRGRGGRSSRNISCNTTDGVQIPSRESPGPFLP